MKESRSKVIHYKRAVIPNCAATLQEIIDSIISENGSAPKVSMRREQINPADSDSGYRMVNRSNTFKTVLFGQLILFEQGKSQTLMTIADDVNYYDINAITSKQIKLEGDEKISEEEKQKIKREFVDSILYFGIRGNHVMIVQSSSLRIKDIETHLNWLIHSFGSIFDTDSFLILQDKPTEETIKKMHESPVKKINLGSVPIKNKEPSEVVNITHTANTQDLSEVARSPLEKVKKIKFMPTGKGGDIIRAAFGEGWFNDLKLEDSLDESNLQVNLEITYFRKTNKDGQRVLDTLATSLRNIDDDEISINLQGGGTIKGNDLKLSGKVNVQFNNGLIDENDLYLQMHKWLASKVQAGEISVKKQ
ncbi:hypothetical protein P851_03137 [Klebsiella aerogenes UCI 48]|uniref:hypothetical protein n=1 Tax=Klebsiella aerogenes TaxID=548 RepID=UPI00044BDF56|nr:hypothetical protein [Klebsiella aerogenes]EKZ9746363.1 hypothetical protein [Klebsiella aerogenes]EKZ9923695.1 hypothetical protein [Klebsiella aerogenes]EUL33727.1 hypothetical protein P851_03137 [Klebsiella aerogenes UCI 48]EUL45885.1 hypothetical protein P850_03140 [Klebsiella aerogenes UCI 47]KDF29658.1 hypothetical protein AE03_02557 [Klebsiella aerogenes MGH 77]